MHATAIMYTPEYPTVAQEAQIIRRDLKPLGIDVQVKEFPVGDYFSRITRPGEPFDLAVSGYTVCPGSRIHTRSLPQLRPGRSAATTSRTSKTRAFDRKLEGGGKAVGGEALSGRTTGSRSSSQRDAAPAAAIATNASRDFFSARIGCQIYQPVYGIDIAALCLRR